MAQFLTNRSPVIRPWPKALVVSSVLHGGIIAAAIWLGLHLAGAGTATPAAIVPDAPSTPVSRASEEPSVVVHLALPMPVRDVAAAGEGAAALVGDSPVRSIVAVSERPHVMVPLGTTASRVRTGANHPRVARRAKRPHPARMPARHQAKHRHAHASHRSTHPQGRPATAPKVPFDPNAEVFHA